MVAGSGTDGIEARFPAKTRRRYHFRPNCTVGFYNQNKPGANAIYPGGQIRDTSSPRKKIDKVTGA